jgi:DNA-binding transcriptional LysR family regulator
MSVGKFPNLRLLHVFITVAKYQGYANAQQELNLTVSAISNYMSELEEKLGIILCRGRGGFSLTEKGETVLQQSIDLLNSLEDFERNTATLRGEQTGIFNLGVIDSTITDPMLPMSDIIATFSERFPRVQINAGQKSERAFTGRTE